MKITVFQEFYIEHNGESIEMSKFLSKQSLSLFQIFAMNYNKVINSNRLINMFWENSTNPQSALKYNIYRLRIFLKKIPFFQDKEVIHTRKGGYIFYFDEEVIVDCLEVIRLYEKIKQIKYFDQESVKNALTICEYYTGRLYEGDKSISFVQEAEYYDLLYVKTVDKLWDYYHRQHMLKDHCNIFLKAAILEPSIERVHIQYMKCLLEANEYTQAYNYYMLCSNTLVQSYGLELSMEMKNIYEEIIANNNERVSMSTIRTHYENKAVTNGAYFCDNATFNYLCEVRLRDAKRNQQNYYLIMYELKPSVEDPEKQIEYLYNAILESMRNTDIFTKLNKYQFLVLLPCDDKEMVSIIAARVNYKFYGKNRVTKNHVNYYIKEIGK